MEPMESPLSRVQAALAKLERPIICTNCGGRWFQIAEFHRLAQTGYASLEFDPTEAMSQTVRVCLCGKIVKAIPQVRAGPTPNAELKSFAESMDLAAEHPHTATQGQVGKVQTELNAVIEQAATRSELHLLKLEIAALRDENTSLRDQLAPLRDQINWLARELGVDLTTKTDAAPRREGGAVEGSH